MRPSSVALYLATRGSNTYLFHFIFSKKSMEKIKEIRLCKQCRHIGMVSLFYIQNHHFYMFIFEKIAEVWPSCTDSSLWKRVNFGEIEPFLWVVIFFCFRGPPYIAICWLWQKYTESCKLLWNLRVFQLWGIAHQKLCFCPGLRPRGSFHACNSLQDSAVTFLWWVRCCQIFYFYEGLDE